MDAGEGSSMSHVTLASLLTDYGVSDASLPPESNEPPVLRDDITTPDESFERLPGTSTSALEDAFNRGFEEGQREAEARLAHDLGEQRAAAEAKLDRARKTWAMDFGKALSDELTSAVENMHGILADNFSDVLLPIIRNEVRCEAVRKIAAVIRETVASDWQGPLIVEGPNDLLEALQEHLADMKSIVDCRISDGPDIKVTIDETVLETQLAAWGDAVKRLLT